MYTIPTCTNLESTLSLHFKSYSDIYIIIYIHRVYTCMFRLAVTCHLHFWQNDQDVLHGAMVTQRWNKYRNNSTESWPWRRTFSCCSFWDLKPQPFNNKSGTQPLSCPCWTDLRYSKELAYSLLEEEKKIVCFVFSHFSAALFSSTTITVPANFTPEMTNCSRGIHFSHIAMLLLTKWLSIDLWLSGLSKLVIYFYTGNIYIYNINL